MYLWENLLKLEFLGRMVQVRTLFCRCCGVALCRHSCRFILLPTLSDGLCLLVNTLWEAGGSQVLKVPVIYKKPERRGDEIQSSYGDWEMESLTVFAG